MAKIGNFEVLELLGRGAMGSVYRAVDPVIGRLVAIKVVRLIGYNDGEEAAFLKDRLFKEARAAGSLSHPGIVTVHQLGTQDEEAYIVMEYIDGSTLESRLVSGTPADPQLLERVMVDVAAALDYAHQCGIVHRDVKPANIMLTGPASGRPGAVKITDFGIAKTLLGHTSTNTGMILGSPYYMSPEQVSGLPLDGRSDQFALAVIAYQMLSGSRPFRAERVTGICFQIVHAQPPLLAETHPDIPLEVSQVLNRALDKDPARRFPTCSAFAAALVDALRRAPTIAIPPPSPPPRRVSPRWTLALTVAAGLLLVAAAAARIGKRPLPHREVARAGGTRQFPAAKPLPPPVRIEPREPAPAPPPSESSGWVVWTGEAKQGTLLRIEDDRASIGRMHGRLPGGPIVVRAFPADRGPKRLTVFTSDQRYASPLRAATSAGPALFLWDPRRITDLTLWEAPNRANDWRRLVIRVNSPQLTACTIQWRKVE